MKTTVLWVLLTSFGLVGCGSISQPGSSVSDTTGNLQPPRASVMLNRALVPTVINGYQWSNGSNSVVADAAFDPAKGLKPYKAPVQAQATLRFEQSPKSIQLTTWSDGQRISEVSLTGASFTLPKQPGDYTFEVTGHWGKDYVNYDFEVHLH